MQFQAKEAKLEEDVDSYKTGSQIIGVKSKLPSASTDTIPISPSQLVKAANCSSQIIDMYTKEVFNLNPGFKYTVSDYFECFKKSLNEVLSTKQQNQQKENESQQIKLMMFLLMTGLPKFEYELFGFKCQSSQTQNVNQFENEAGQQKKSKNDEGNKQQRESNDKDEEIVKNMKRPQMESSEKDSLCQDLVLEKSSYNEQRSKQIRRAGRPKKRKYFFSNKNQ